MDQSTKFLIAGLGNIGAEYINTRHNIGFDILDVLAATEGFSFTSGRHAYVAEYRFKGRTFILIKPTTYMNLSGKAIAYWLQKEKIQIENLLVICDDLALPQGSLRLKARGNDGGHNGLIDIGECLGSIDFARLRFGIGNDFPKGFQVDYVLGKWGNDEWTSLQPKMKESVEIIKAFGTIGIQRTMNLFNRKS